MKLPRIMLGANPFHGVSYKNSNQRREYRLYFNSVARIYEIIERSIELGVRGVHLYTNNLEIKAVDQARRKFGDRLCVVAVIPDIYGALSRQAGTQNVKIITNLAKLKVLLKNSAGFFSASVKGDLIPFVKKILDTELNLIRETQPNFVLLHGTLVDIISATKQGDIFKVFFEKIKGVSAIPGLASHNFYRLVECLQTLSINFPVIMAPFNQKGFMMNPSNEACVKKLNEIRNQTIVIAKKVLAGGVLDPFIAQHYIFSELNMESAAIGVGTLFEAEKTFYATKKILGERFNNEIEVNEYSPSK